jgi:hypothetical protein
MELALAKPIEVSKKVRPSDVAASSQGPHAMGATMTRAARVPVFDNLGDDSSPDVHKTTSPTMMIGKCTSPPPSVSGELCLLGSYFLLRARTSAFADPTRLAPSLDLPLRNPDEDKEYCLHHICFGSAFILLCLF